MDSFLISFFLFYEAEQRFGLCLIFRRECLKIRHFFFFNYEMYADNQVCAFFGTLSAI